MPATAPRALRRANAADQAPHDARRQSRAARQLAQRNAEVRAGHRRLRTGLWHYLSRAELATLVTSPVIYSVVVPFVVLDAWVWVYQAVCFRAWGIRPVRRRAYFAIDRHKLAYLNAFEKVNCLFCSYANGVIACVREVAARTEQYWCPIRHARRIRQPHPYYDAFLDYGDAAAYRRQLPRLRGSLKE